MSTDIYAAKLARYNALSERYTSLLNKAGPDVSDQGRSIQWTSMLNNMQEELRKLEVELRQGESVELVSSMFPL